MFPANPGALEKQIAASSFNSEDRAPAKWSFSGLYWSSGKGHRRALEKQIRVFLTNAGVLEKQIGTFPVNSVALDLGARWRYPANPQFVSTCIAKHY